MVRIEVVMILHTCNDISDFDYRDMRVWCREQFGKGGNGRWHSLFYSKKIHFRDEVDYALFLLRWL